MNLEIVVRKGKSIRAKFYLSGCRKSVKTWWPNLLFTCSRRRRRRDSNSFSFYRQTLIMDFFYYYYYYAVLSAKPGPRPQLLYAGQLFLGQLSTWRGPRTSRNARAVSNLLNKIINTYQGQRLLLFVSLSWGLLLRNFRIALVPKLGQTGRPRHQRWL